MGNTHSNNKSIGSDEQQPSTENIQTTQSDTKSNVSRRNSRVKERVFKHFHKKSSKDSFLFGSSKSKSSTEDFQSIIPITNETVLGTTTIKNPSSASKSKKNKNKAIVIPITPSPTKNRRQSDDSINDQCGNLNNSLNLSDTDGSLLPETPSIDFDWSSVDCFAKMPVKLKNDSSGDTLGSITRDFQLGLMCDTSNKRAKQKPNNDDVKNMKRSLSYDQAQQQIHLKLLEEQYNVRMVKSLTIDDAISGISKKYQNVDKLLKSIMDEITAKEEEGDKLSSPKSEIENNMGENLNDRQQNVIIELKQQKKIKKMKKKIKKSKLKIKTFSTTPIITSTLSNQSNVDHNLYLLENNIADTNNGNNIAEHYYYTNCMDLKNINKNNTNTITKPSSQLSPVIIVDNNEIPSVNIVDDNFFVDIKTKLPDFHLSNMNKNRINTNIITNTNTNTNTNTTPLNKIPIEMLDGSEKLLNSSFQFQPSNLGFTSNILRSVDDGSVFDSSTDENCLDVYEKSEIDFKKLNKSDKNQLKLNENNYNLLNLNEKYLLYETNSWKTAKLLEIYTGLQKQQHQTNIFTDDQFENCRVIQLRESSTESESLFTDPLTSPTDNETTFKSIENYNDSSLVDDSSLKQKQYFKRASSFRKHQKYIQTKRKSSSIDKLSVLDKLARSEVVYLSIDSNYNSKSNSESPEDDLQMAIHLRNKLAQMLSNEDQKARVDASTSPGLFNVARAKKVELQNLSSRLVDNNIAGISPKILHEVQNTSTQSYTDQDGDYTQTLSPSCFGSFGDSNVLKKVASFITAEKSGNSEPITPRKSSLIPEKLNFSAYEKFEGQMLVKWITNSLQSTGCNLSEQTLNLLTQQYCTNLLSIGVIKPMLCEKTDKNDTFNPYQMYQWAHREPVTTSNPVTPGRLDAEIIWPHATTPTSSLKIPRSIQVDIPTTTEQLNNYNNNNNNNHHINSISNTNNNHNSNNLSTNNNNIILKDFKLLSNGNNSNGNGITNHCNTNCSNNLLDNNYSSNNTYLCGDRKVFELKKSLLNCNTLSEVYEVVETLLPDRKPSTSIIVNYQSPHRSPSAILNDSEITLYGNESIDSNSLSQSQSTQSSASPTLNKCYKINSPSTSNSIQEDQESLDTTEENTPSLPSFCCKCGQKIKSSLDYTICSTSNEINNEIQACSSSSGKITPTTIDQILQTSFDDKTLGKEIEINSIDQIEKEDIAVVDSCPVTPTNQTPIEAINEQCIKTSTPTNSSTPTDEIVTTNEPEIKISPVVECVIQAPPPPPPPVPPPAPPFPPLLLPPPPPALPNFNNLRSTGSSSSNGNNPALNSSGTFRSPSNLQKTISNGSSNSPPSPAPFPMPPSSGSWFQTNNTLRKNAVNPPKPMKPLYWTRIVTSKPLFPSQSSEEKTDSSPEEEIKEEKPQELWQEIDETSLDNFVIDEFTDLFSRQAIVPQNKPTRVKSNLAKTIKILDSKRSQTVGIFYRSLHIDLEEIEHAIYHCETSVVSLEILHHIMDIKATSEELAMIKEAAMGETPLDAPEQFLLRISQISSSSERISCLVFQAEFDEGSTLVARKLEVVKRLSEFLTDSDDLKLLFSIILTLGNYMNGGNRARGQADGFGLEILGKLKDVKSKDSKVTLLHFIVKTYIGRKRKSGTPLVEIGLPIPEPSDVERAAAVDFDEVKLQIMDLQKKLRICQSTTEKVISSSNEENIQPFKKKMEDFIEMGDKKIEKQLCKLDECQESFLKTMKFYHFIPKSGDLSQCTPAQFFEYWTNFSNDFKDIWKKEITMLTNELIKKVKSQQKVQSTQSVTNSSRPKLKPGGLKDRLQRMAKK